jgi:hypothetical protein
MKKLKILVTTLTLGIILYGCGNNSIEKNQDQLADTSHESQSNDAENTELKLNNNEKWIVSSEMRPFIVNSEIILKDYIDKNSNDYKTLATQITENNSGLIKSCTMKGESHDELHKWLYPHMELIESLSNAESTQEAVGIISKLQASFSTYNQYFQ